MPKSFQGGLFCVLLVLASTAVLAQERTDSVEQEKHLGTTRTKLRPELETLISTSQAQPVEYFADIIFRILASEPKLDFDLKTELLTMVFERAANAVRPHHLTYLGRDPRLLDILYLPAASNLYLDQLSIKVKAIRALADLDPELAIEWLEALPSEPLPVASCESLASADADSLYEFLLTSAKPLYESQKRESDYYALLARYYGALSSPMQLPTATKLLSILDIPDDRFTELLTVFTGRLAHLRGDDTSFAIALTQGTIFTRKPFLDELHQLVKRLKDRGEAPGPLIQAARTFLVTHLQQTRCANGVRPRVRRGQDGPYQKIVKQYNEQLLPYGASSLAPITREETEPSAVDSETTPPRMNLERDLICLRDVFMGLSSAEQPVNWKATLDGCLSQVDKWEPKQGSKCLECVLASKTKAYVGLIQMSVDPEDTEYVAGAYFRFLEQNALRQTQPAAWLIGVKALFNMTRSIHRDDEEKIVAGRSVFHRPVKDPTELLRVLRASHDPIISTYAQLENL